MFKILKKSKLAKRLDHPENFGKQSGIYDENTKRLWDYMRYRILTIQIFVLLQLIQKNTLKI